MANTRAYNVTRIDTTGAFPEIRRVRSIVAVPVDSALNIVVRKGSGTGAIVWQSSGTARLEEGVPIQSDTQGLHVTVTAGVLFIYS